MRKGNFKYFLIAVLVGLMIGKYVYNEYKNDALSASLTNENDIYLIQYGVYDNEESMKTSTKELNNFFFFEEDNKYYVIIGITKNTGLKDKIIKAYNISTEVYMKKVSINNYEFLELLSQYDNLINQTDDNELILISEKQILSKYEEIITNE